MRLTPIVGFDHSDGSITTVGMLPGRKNITNKFLNFVIKKVDANKKYRMLVSHCDAIEEAEKFAELLKNDLYSSRKAILVLRLSVTHRF